MSATPKGEKLKDSDVQIEEEQAKEAFQMGIPSSSSTPEVELPAVSETQISNQTPSQEMHPMDFPNVSRGRRTRRRARSFPPRNLDLVLGNIARRRRTPRPRTGRSSEKLCSAANIYMDADETNAAEALLKLENDLLRRLEPAVASLSAFGAARILLEISRSDPSRTLEDAASWKVPRRPRTPRTAIQH